MEHGSLIQSGSPGTFPFNDFLDGLPLVGTSDTLTTVGSDLSLEANLRPSAASITNICAEGLLYSFSRGYF